MCAVSSLSLAIVLGISPSTISPRIVAEDLLSTLPNPKLVLAVASSAKSDKLLAFANFSPIDVAVVVAKLASSPRAAASSFRVSNASGAESTTPAT